MRRTATPGMVNENGRYGWSEYDNLDEVCISLTSFLPGLTLNLDRYNNGLLTTTHGHHR